jgi:nucleoside-diphosphate-sugar epimerase
MVMARSSLVILGASGFLGRTLLDGVHLPMPVKAVSRNIPSGAALTQNNVTWRAADLSTSMSLIPVLDAGDVVINLAYSADGGEVANLQLIDSIVEACLRSGVARLVHCSTAIVAGKASSSRVVESTPCVPQTQYERTKWAVEKRVLAALSKGLDVAVLRPTAILGPGGQNLVTLARALQNGNRLINYLRASCFGRRAMHLVPARNVAGALLHVALLPAALGGNVYIVSSDNDPENNFQDVERALLRALGLKPRKLPLLPVPPQLLSILLWLLGRSDTDTTRTYDPQKLRETNFEPIDSVADAVREFGDSIRHTRSAISTLEAAQNGTGR